MKHLIASALVLRFIVGKTLLNEFLGCLANFYFRPGGWATVSMIGRLWVQSQLNKKLFNFSVSDEQSEDRDEL